MANSTHRHLRMYLYINMFIYFPIYICMYEYMFVYICERDVYIRKYVFVCMCVCERDRGRGGAKGLHNRKARLSLRQVSSLDSPDSASEAIQTLISMKLPPQIPFQDLHHDLDSASLGSS